MDPNHWNQYNQAYGRLTSGTAMSGGSAPLNRYDLSLLDQSGLGAPGMSGLGTLSPSLGPAHTLSPARGMPGLPNLNYGHPVHSSMSQLLDTMNSLGQTFPNPPTYKALPPTSQHMYGLPETLFLPDPLGDSQMTKQSLFNTDPHTMKETASEAGTYGTLSTPSDAKSSWGLSNFVPPPSNPFGSISESPTSVFSLTPEPPPAHSGSRPSTIQRNPYQKPEYQPKNDYPSKSDFPAKTEHNSRNDYHLTRPSNSDFRSDFPPKQEYHAPSAKPEYRHSDFPAKQEFQSRSHSKSEYQSHTKKSRTSSGHSQSFMDSAPRTTTTGHGMQHSMNQSQSSLPSHSYPSSPHVSNPSTFPSSPHMNKPQVSHSQHSISEYNPYYPASSGFSSVPCNTVTYTSGSNMEPLTYDPVSPPSNLPTSRSHNSHSHNYALSLQEITNMGTQEKLHLTDTQSHMANSSPIRVQNKIQGMGGVASTPSPMQPSPISVGSPQVPMASPHNHMSGQMASPQMAGSSVPPVPIPIQAVADSTTKPKRSRSRKKKEKTPDLKMMYPGPPPPLTSPHPMTTHQQLTSHPITPTHMMSEPNDRYTMSESDTSMYMTNSYEDTFMSPSQLLGDAMMPLSAHGTDTSPLVMEHPMHHDLESPIDRMQTIDPNALMDSGFSHGPLHNLDTMTYQHEQVYQKQQKQKRNRTKAEQKEMPGAYFMAPQEVMPVQQRGFQVPQQAEIIQDDEFTHLQRDPLNEGPKQTVVPKKGTGVSSFQSSFLSFLQGNKQETLSCITNSVVSKKPTALPKNFMPEAPRLQQDTFVASPTLLAESDLKMKALDKSIDVPAVTFSDDEDNSVAFSNTVQNVISNLSDDSKSEHTLNNPTSATSQEFSFLTTEHASTGTGKNVAINPHVPKSTKPKTVVSNDPEFLPSNDMDVNSDDDMLLEKRTLAARKTKEKKVKTKKPKKKRKKKRHGSDSSDSSVSEKGYDSDKDPVWMPFETEGARRHHSSDSDNENKGKRNRKDRKSSSSKTSKRSKTYKNVGVINTIGGVPASGDGASHKFQKGDFVVENKTFVGNSYPVWKIDAGRLLQKFEPFEYKGIKCHKGLSTYSSWSPELKDQYKAIQVQPIHNDSLELVQIIQKSKPNGQTPDDPLLEDFNVYMQILISRALEASFLQVVQEEGEDFYLQPLQKIDALIEKNKKTILGKVNWTDKFRESVERRPYMNCVDRLGLSKACQACQDHSQPAIKSVELYGTPYNLHTLDTLDYLQCPSSDEFLIGELTATYISTYHGLHHFKFSTFKRCTAKVDLIKEENPEVKGHEILDQCLQNRNWVLKIFQDFKRSLVTSRGSNGASVT